MKEKIQIISVQKKRLTGTPEWLSPVEYVTLGVVSLRGRVYLIKKKKKQCGQD